ncbi:hypothetical protein [Teichococcus vastitatis]|uniref:DUF2946 domain-containing protein n=1 Tax=Teichococcus vastitatis TaxID=2307076 RepID=A0ABS9W6B1_9PROT|nr:hypothetical protein [Pseudoroseomonas vastitatis]MCI0754119.1 hypothetical protein [Pseudoroseomonas vastitatis]
MRTRPDTWRALGREMLCVLLSLSLFLQLMAGAEAAIPRGAPVNPSVLCSLHPPKSEAPQEHPGRDQHALCCILACGIAQAGLPALPPVAPLLPAPAGRLLFHGWPSAQPLPAGALRTAYGARAPPFDA